MDDVTLLRGVLTRTGDLIEGIDPDQWERSTPCPDFDVRGLVGHMVGWVEVFAAGAQGEKFDGDPGAYRAGPDAAKRFRAATDGIVEGWSTHGTDRSVRLTGGELPGPMMVNMTAMEYCGHGWDLATALGMSPPFTEEEAEEALTRAKATLPPEYRGAGKGFGEIVPVPDDAPAIDRLAGFLGREPV